MKKLLIFIISSLFLTSFVSAEELEFSVNYYQGFDSVISDINSGTSTYDTLLSCYSSTYEETYSHYFVIANTSNSTPTYTLYMSDTSFDTLTYYRSSYGNDWQYTIGLPINYTDAPPLYALTSTCSSWEVTNTTLLPIYQDNPNFSLVSSNSNLILSSSSDKKGEETSFEEATLQMPSYSSSEHDLTFQYFELTKGSILPSYISLYEGDYIPGVSYTSINLNNYDYVALSLRDYTQTQAFSTNFIVEGQLCITPVYDYGMTEKTGAGYKVQRCSPVYSTPSPMRVDIIENDLKNHAIYYLKAYNTSISNIIKVDSSIFNITYIDSSTSQPYVNVNGVQYPSIPYSQLTSSATLSESEGYVSGEVTNVFDASGDSEFIENLFSNPLETLQSTWGTILTMFGLIGSFINLLPEVLQAFLYTTLALALTIGIIKILT